MYIVFTSVNVTQFVPIKVNCQFLLPRKVHHYVVDSNPLPTHPNQPILVLVSLNTLSHLVLF